MSDAQRPSDETTHTPLATHKIELGDVRLTPPSSPRGRPMSPLTPNTPGVSSFNREVDAFLDKHEERLKRHRGARFYCVWATVLWAATMAALGAFFVHSDRTTHSCATTAAPRPRARDATLTKFAWGSCADQMGPQPYWDAVHRYGPDLLILAGDNVYGDCETPGCPELAFAYRNLTTKPSFVGAAAAIPMVFAWDDHDFGLNDGGAANPYLAHAKELFLSFVEAGPRDERRSRPGTYTSYAFGAGDRRVQIVILDTRSFRSDFSLDSNATNATGPYAPRPDGFMLGDLQWQWLEDRLREPAALRLLVSSIQIVADGHAFECWRMIPGSARGSLAGARRGDRPVGRPAQGRRLPHARRVPRVHGELVHAHDALRPRPAGRGVRGRGRAGPYGPMVHVNHFGTVDVDWDRRVASVALRRAETEQGNGHLSVFDDVARNSAARLARSSGAREPGRGPGPRGPRALTRRHARGVAAPGSEVVFENINIVGFLARGFAEMRRVASLDKAVLLREAQRAIQFDDLVVIVAFNLLSTRRSGPGARAFVVKRGSGVAVWFVCCAVCFEVLRFNIGLTLGSIVSFAGISGIALGFATKDLVSNWVGGALLVLTRPFVPGDKIQMTSLDKAVVEQIGWYQCLVRGDDDQFQTVPNSKFLSNKVSNLSQRKHRYMKQAFRIRYEDLPRAEAICDRLRAELRAVDGVDPARRFYIFVKALRETDVEIEVEVHFKGSSGLALRERRQAALLKIAEVVRDEGAEFAVFSALLAPGAPAPRSRPLCTDAFTSRLEDRAGLALAWNERHSRVASGNLNFKQSKTEHGHMV
ncbi:PhoD-like phosphatase [Aureococcus anophagefferens]|nr:PhoD-like phosphatase [Aureococcus anophagefferens]